MHSKLFELKKIMFYQRGIWYFIAFLFFSLFWLLLTDTPENVEMDQYQEGYSWYLMQVEGPYSQKKADFLEKEAQKIAETQSAQQALLNRYYDGQLSETEVEAQLAQQEEVLKFQSGFDVLYDQYLYIRENPESRYFLQTNGWSGLLNQTTFPFPLFLALLLMIVPIFCGEYGSKMDILIQTTQEGRRAVSHKVLFAASTVIFLNISEALVRLSFFAVKYGLPHGDYPIQSISYFGDYTQPISLMGGYWTIVALRTFGCLTLTALILLLSVWLRKYAITMLVIVAATLLPYLGLTTNQIYHLPFPLGFLLATDFFKGTVVSSDPLTGEEVLLFAEVSRGELLILAGILLFLSIGALLMVYKRTSNQWSGSQRPRKSHRYLPGILFLILLSGCTGQSEEQSRNASYNSSTNSCENGYEVIFDEEEQTYFLQSYNGGEKLALDQSPFSETTNAGTILSIFCQGDDVYYLKKRTESYIDRVGFYNSTADIVSITKLNTKTFEETIIWEQIISAGRSVLGIEYQVSDQWNFLMRYNKFFLNESDIFFICDSNIRKVDRKTNRISIIDIPANKNIAFDGENIFYLDRLSNLIKYDTHSATFEKIRGVIAENFFMTEEKIYYINLMDDDKIYVCNLDRSEAKKVFDASAISFTIKNNALYYTDKKDGLEYSIDLIDNNIPLSRK